VVDKQQIRSKLKRLQRFKTWQLLIILILAGFVSATFLRLNNIGMVERRAAVITADNTGDPKITQNRLYDLQRYVSAHMNTDMGRGVYLESSYKRDIKIAYDKVSNNSNPNGNIYKKAQEVCAPKFTHYSYAYLQCTTNELAKYPSSDKLINSVNLPRADMYLHAFSSPTWSPDFAGWSLVICGIIFMVIIARIIGVIILRIMLRYRYKSI
jgi:hypothetical protein